MTDRDVIWRLQLTMEMMSTPSPPSGVTMPRLRRSLLVLVQALLDRETLSEDQAESLRCWARFAPGDDLLEAFESPSVNLDENPWLSYEIEGEDDE